MVRFWILTAVVGLVACGEIVLQLDGLAPGGSSVILLSATGSNTNVSDCTFFIGLTPPIVALGSPTVSSCVKKVWRSSIASRRRRTAR